MLSPSTHPAGSQAMLRGTPGKIHQWLGNGTALFFPQRGPTYRAQAAELDPLPDLPPFDAWAAERIASVHGHALTTGDIAEADYRTWCARNRVPESEVLPCWRFAAAMLKAGYIRERRSIRLPGEGQRRSRNCWQIALHA